MKKVYLYRLLNALGLRVERARDSITDLQALAGADVHRVVDGGAYKGTVSQEFLKVFPDAEVHAFEPQADLYSALADLSSSEPRWHVHQLALSNEEGVSVFHVPSAKYTGSLLVPGEKFGSASEQSVNVTTIDKLAQDYGPVDVMKLDLQGAELPALRGAASALSQVRAILCEVNFVPRYENCSMFHEIAAFLAQHGFLLHRVYEVRSLTTGAWEMGDAIFVHPERTVHS